MTAMTETENFSSRTNIKRITRRILDVTLFNWSNRILDQTISLSTLTVLDQSMIALRSNSQRIARKGWGKDRAGLRKMLKREFNFTDIDIDQMIENGPTDKQYSQALQTARANINAVGESALDKPRWMSSFVWSQVFAFTSYLRIQGNTAKDAINAVHDAGDYKPIVTLLAAPVALTGVQVALLGQTLKDWVFDREKEDEDYWDVWMQSYMEAGTFGMLGYMGEQVYWQTRFGGVNVLSAPVPNAVVDMIVGSAENLLNIAENGPTEAARKEAQLLLGAIPAFRGLDNIQSRLRSGDLKESGVTDKKILKDN